MTLELVPATTGCKNVETPPRKNDLSCFKSLLVTGHGQAIYAKIRYSVSSTFATGCSYSLPEGPAVKLTFFAPLTGQPVKTRKGPSSEERQETALFAFW